MKINENQSKTMKNVKKHVKSNQIKQKTGNTYRINQKHEKSTENPQIYKTKRKIDKRCQKTEEK